MAPKRAAASAPPHFSTPLYHTFPRLGTAPAPNLLSGNNSLPLGTFQHQPGHGPQAPRLRRGRRASPAGAVLPDGPACGPPPSPRPHPASHKPRPAGSRPPGGSGGLRPPMRGSAPRPCGPHPHHSHQVQSSLSPPSFAALRRPAAAYEGLRPSALRAPPPPFPSGPKFSLPAQLCGPAAACGRPRSLIPLPPSPAPNGRSAAGTAAPSPRCPTASAPRKKPAQLPRSWPGAPPFSATVPPKAP